MKKTIAAILFLSFLALPAFAEPTDDCIKGDVEDQITGCSIIIDTGMQRGKPVTMDNLPAIYVIRGTAFAEKGQSEKAFADYAKAIALDPELTMAYGDRGQLYNKLGDYKKAIADFNKGVQLDGKFDVGYAGLARAWLQLGDSEKAIKFYTKAIELIPSYEEYYYLRASVYMKEFEKSGKLSKPKMDAVFDDLAKVLKRDPDHKAAQKALKQLGVY